MARMMVCKDCGEERAHKAHGLCVNCYQHKWWAENREKERARLQEWRNDNPEKVRAYQRKQYAKNPEYWRQWVDENREKIQAYQHKWWAENPELRRHYSQQRRAKMNNLPNTLTEQDWQEILDVWDYRCAYCGEHDFNLAQEHVTPVCQGGGYIIENIVPSCKACNSKKGGRTPTEAGMSFYYQKIESMETIDEGVKQL